jgi:hypothetical protein
MVEVMYLLWSQEMVLISIPTVLFVLAVSCIVVSTSILWREIDEINRKLSSEEQISYLWMYTDKRLRIRSEYRRLYPNGRLERAGFTLEILGFVLLACAAVSAGFFDHWLRK